MSAMERSSLRALRGLAVALSLVSTQACTTLYSWFPKEGCPVVPVSSAALPDTLSLRARMQVRARDVDIGLEVVAQVEAGELVVVGLAPYGTRLFTVHQRGREFEIEAMSSAKLGLLATWVMDALHRSHWIGPEDADSARFAWAGEVVRESAFDGGRRRAFRRAGEDSAAPGVTIDYLRSPASRSAVIRSEWCGYEAVVAILDE